MESLFRLDNKVAIVTGGSQGLGKAMALALAQAGANVVVGARTVSKADEVSQEIIQAGGNAMSIRLDVGDADSVNGMVKATLDKFETIDILVNNAGVNLRHPCVEMPEEEWDTVIRTNLKGTFLCSQAVGRIMLPRKTGKVINIASLLGTVAQPNRGPYAASKGGIIQFTKVLALEWAPYNINVNAIGPGYFLTELNTKLMDDRKTFDELTSRIPMGKWADPQDIGGPVVFLASEASKYVTGHVLFVDGGYLCL